MKTNQWLKDKLTITLSRKEMFDLANVIANGTRNDYEFTKSRNRRIRKLFAYDIQKNRRLWLKIIHTAENRKL